MNEESVELLYQLQVQQIDLKEKLMEKWLEVGDSITEILEIHGQDTGHSQRRFKEGSFLNRRRRRRPPQHPPSRCQVRAEEIIERFSALGTCWLITFTKEYGSSLQKRFTSK